MTPTSDPPFSHPAFSHAPSRPEPAMVLAAIEASDSRYEQNREIWMKIYGVCETCAKHPHRTICGGCNEPEEDCSC